MRALKVSAVLALAACSSSQPSPSADAGANIVTGDVVDVTAPMDVVDVPVSQDVPMVGDAACTTTLDVPGRDAMADIPSPTRPPPTPPMDETCPNTFAACTPMAGSAEFVRIKGTVVSPERVVCDGEVLYSTRTGRILCAGADCSMRPEAAGATVVCSEGVISPGLIDPHQHLQFNSLPVWRHGRSWSNRGGWQRDDEYDRFTRASSAARSNNTGTCRVLKWSEARILAHGGTALVGAPSISGCTTGLVRDLDVRGEAGLPDELVTREDTFPLNGSANDLNNQRMRLMSGTNRVWVIHVSEGIDLVSRSEFDQLGAAGLHLPNVTVVHGTGLSTEQLARMRAAGMTLVWSPRSNVDLYGETAYVTAARALGVPIALGVDWTPSGSMGPLGELQCADRLNGRYYDHAFSDRELVVMATLNGARATRLDDTLGRLQDGYRADILVLRGDRTRPYRTIINARPGAVRLVTVEGRAAYGDADVVTGPLAPNALCDAIPGDVCGRPKVLCLRNGMADESLTTIRDQLTLALNEARSRSTSCSNAPDICYSYNLMPLVDPATCDGPEVERCDFGHGAISGRPVEGDADGDSVPDCRDNCPRVFNPARIAATQDDLDGDGVGDLCDPCPLTPGTTCAVNAEDIDGDMRPNAMDNCPSRHNPDQTDTDMDMRGDACDLCPMEANPGSTPCTVSLPTLRNPAAQGYPGFGTTVRVRDAVVTAIRAGGSVHAFWIQDPAATSWAGVQVFLAGAAVPAGLAVGNRVSMQGIYTLFSGAAELDRVSMISITDNGTAVPFEPRVVPAADIATGGRLAAELEGMLVRVEDVAVTSANPDAPMNFDEFAVTGGLRVDDYILDNGTNNMMPAYPVGTRFRSITGVLYFSFGNMKIVPRSAADIVPAS